MTDILHRLEQIIAERQHASPETSYVARRFAKGRLKLAEKLGEEATETVIAAIAQDDAALAGEAADLLFHLLLVLGERGVALDAVLTVLEQREGISGIDEKAARPAD